MAFVKKDRCWETSTTSGTGNLTLAGAAAANLRAFASVMATGDFCYGFAAERASANWEINTFTMQSDGTLARGTPFASSNGGALVSFGGGVLDVVMDAPADDTASLANGNDFVGSPNTFQKGPVTVYTDTASLTSRAVVVNVANTGHTGDVVVFNNKNGGVSFRQDADGNVQIGPGSGTLAGLVVRQNTTGSPLGYANVRLGGQPAFLMEDSSGNLFSFNNVAGDMRLDSNGVPKVYVLGTDGSIGVGGTAPNAQAQLDLEGTTKGLLLPRLTTAAKNALSTVGLLVFDTNLDKACVRTSGGWETITSS